MNWIVKVVGLPPIRLVPMFASSCTLTFTIVTQETVSWPTVNLFIVMFEIQMIQMQIQMLALNACDEWMHLNANT